MSDRRNAYRYTGAPDVRVPTMPTNSGMSLIDLITGNTPRHLLGMQQQFGGQQAEAERKHQKEMEELMHKHDQEMETLKARLVNEKTQSDQVTAYMTSRNIADTPANRERVAKELTDLDFQNAAQMAQNRLQANKSDEVKNATQKGEAAKQLLPTTELTKASQQLVPAGATGVMTDYARNSGGKPDVTTGSLPQQSVANVTTMKGPNGMQISQPVPLQSTSPGSFTSGFNGVPQKPIPVDPSIRQSILNNSNSISTPPDDRVPTTPNSFGGWPTPLGVTNAQPTAPIPATQQGPNGQTRDPYAAYRAYNSAPDQLQKQDSAAMLRQQLQQLINNLPDELPTNVNPLTRGNPWGQLAFPQ